MSDEATKILLQEVKEGVTEAVVPAVTEKVMEKVKSQLAEVKVSVEDESAKTKEMQKKSIEDFKEMYSRIEAGAKTVVKTLDTETEDSGEEFVPEYFNSEIIRIAEKYGIMRQDARVVTMRGKTENWPTSSNVQVYRVGEKGKIPLTSPETGQVKLVAKKVAAIIPVSRELLAYANLDVINHLAALAGEATSRAEDYWGFRGLTMGEGIFQNADVPTHIMSPGKTKYEDVSHTDLLALQNLIDDHAFEQGNLKYYLRRSVLNALRQELIDMSDGNLASALAAISLPNLLTIPYRTSAVLPGTLDPNNTGQQAGKPFMGLYNLKHLLMGVARSYEIELSKEATIGTASEETTINLWEQDMVAVRVMESIDFQVSNASKAFATLVTSEDLS